MRSTGWEFEIESVQIAERLQSFDRLVALVRRFAAFGDALGLLHPGEEFGAQRPRLASSAVEEVVGLTGIGLEIE